MFKRLQTILFLAFSGLVVFSFFLFALFVTPHIKTTVISQISDNLFKQINLVKSRYAQLLFQARSTNLIQEKAIADSNLTKSRVTVIRKDGKVLADSATPSGQVDQLQNHADRPEILQLARQKRGVAVRFSKTLGKDLVYVAYPLKDKTGQLLGYLRLSVPTSKVAEVVFRIYRSIIFALFFSVLIATILSVFFSQAFAQPIVRLAEVARKIAQGNFKQTFVRRSKFEVGLLEEAIEKMDQRLAQSFEQLAAEKGRLSAILSSMVEGVLAIDGAGKVILVNPVMERLFSVVEPEVLGRTVREAIYNNEIVELFSRSLEKSKVFNKELNLVTPTGEKHFIAHIAPIMSQDNVTLGAVCVLHDISEIRKLENYRSEFVANVSHELKTPLTAIGNYVETLLAGAIDDKENRREFLAKIEKHAHNLSRLINDILEISRLESGQNFSSFEKIDLTKTVNKAVETLAVKAKKKGIKFKNHLDKKELLITGLEDHIYRAIVNLLDNAINYTEKGGTVEINCLLEQQQARVVVKDNGLGIEADHLERIFERFYRVDKARSRDQGGTGLGLSIVKHVMKLHHGSVSVVSQPGQGSTFTLSFPL